MPVYPNNPAHRAGQKHPQADLKKEQEATIYNEFYNTRIHPLENANKALKAELLRVQGDMSALASRLEEATTTKDDVSQSSKLSAEETLSASSYEEDKDYGLDKVRQHLVGQMMENEDLKTTNLRLKQENTAFNKTILAYSKEIALLKEQVSNQQDILAQKVAESVADLQKKYDQLTEQNARHQKNLSGKGAEIESQKKTIASQKTTISSLQNQITQVIGNANQQKTSLKELGKKNQHQAQELIDLKQKFDAQGAEIARLTEVVALKNGEILNKDQLIDRIQRKLITPNQENTSQKKWEEPHNASSASAKPVIHGRYSQQNRRASSAPAGKSVWSAAEAARQKQQQEKEDSGPLSLEDMRTWLPTGLLDEEPFSGAAPSKKM